MAAKKRVKTKVWIVIGILVVLVVAGACALQMWQRLSPSTLTIKAFAGTVQTATLKAHVPKKIDKAAFAVTGSIADIVKPAVDDGTTISNTDVTLPLTATIASNKTEGTFSGSVEIKDGNTVVASAPVIVVVQKASASSVPSELSHPISDRIMTPQDGAPMVKDELLVGLQLNLIDADQLIKHIADQTKGVIIGGSPDLKMYQVQYKGASLDDLDKKRKDMEWTIGVSFAGYNVLASPAVTTTPNDTGFADPAQPKEDPWDDQFQNKRTWGQRYIGLPQAWAKTTGSKSVRVGIADEGFDFTHPDLKGNILNSKEDSRSNRDNAAENPHGTNVAGTACAQGNNGIGVAGVMQHCGLGLYDFFYGRSWLASGQAAASEVVSAMERAAKDNMRVVNISYGWMSDKSFCNKQFNSLRQQQVKDANKEVRQAIEWAKTNKKDVLWVFGAGNSCHPVSEVAPAALVHNYPDNVMAVSAIAESEDMRPENVAALQWASNYGDEVSVAAPGEAIYTTTAATNSKNGEEYAFSAGTSIAAPFATGLAGLVWSEHKDFTAKQVKQCIVDAANNYGHKVEGHKFKVINVPKTLDCIPDPDPDSPLGSAQPCVFAFATLPERCSSTNPTVTVEFVNVAGSSDCQFESHLSWKAKDDTTILTTKIAGLDVDQSVVLGTHTFTGVGEHLIDHTVKPLTGGPCLILPSLYQFTLLQK